MIYHITIPLVWEAAQKEGVYHSVSLAEEGFIHCSKAEQILRVANTWFSGEEILVLLEIDPDKLMPELRWEAGTDKQDELFPHLYGPINLEAVKRTLEMRPGNGGQFSLPVQLTTT